MEKACLGVEKQRAVNDALMILVEATKIDGYCQAEELHELIFEMHKQLKRISETVRADDIGAALVAVLEKEFYNSAQRDAYEQEQENIRGAF